jgi:hypothetical protein
MSAQPLHVTTLETIGHLDFEPETPCEHSQHSDLPSHRADLLVRVTLPCCGAPGAVIAICLAVWNLCGSGMRCKHCHHTAPRDFFWTVLEVLS